MLFFDNTTYIEYIREWQIEIKQWKERKLAEWWQQRRFKIMTEFNGQKHNQSTLSYSHIII